MGVHSGSINNKFYFTCGLFRGIFVKEHDLIHLDSYDEEKNTLHNRSAHKLLSALSTFIDHRNGHDDSDESDTSIESDNESISSIGTVQTIDDAIFDRIQLKNEDDQDMAFTQILNKGIFMYNPYTNNFNWFFTVHLYII